MNLSGCSLFREVYNVGMSMNKSTLLILPKGDQSSVLDQFNKTVAFYVFYEDNTEISYE